MSAVARVQVVRILQPVICPDLREPLSPSEVDRGLCPRIAIAKTFALILTLIIIFYFFFLLVILGAVRPFSSPYFFLSDCALPSYFLSSSPLLSFHILLILSSLVLLWFHKYKITFSAVPLDKKLIKRVDKTEVLNILLFFILLDL